jgi:hypothetical protein
VAALFVTLPLVGSARGGFAGSIGNAADGAASGSLQLSAAQGATVECATSIAVASNTACTGTLVSNTLATTGTQAVTTTLSATGSLTPSTTTVTEGTCGPLPLLDAQTTTDPMLVRGGPPNTGTTYSTTTAAPAPTGGAGITLDGSSGYTADTVATTNPFSITEVVWFKTTSASLSTGGTLLGFTNTPGLAPTTTDRMLWLDNAGHVVFGVAGSLLGIPTNRELTSAGSYADGRWHMAAASFGAGGTALYVDGANVGTALLSGLLEQSYTGYWHVGWESYTGWTDPPSTPYLAGSVTDAAIFPMLTAAQVTTLYGAGTQATWNTDVAGTNTGGGLTTAATHAWQLGDPPTGVYTGTPSWYPSPATPCTYVNATIGVTAGAAVTCAAPVAASACTAPTSSVTLASLAGLATTLPSPVPATPDSIAVTTARSATAVPTALAGLHLNFTETISATAGPFAATLGWPSTQALVL